jgi:hypothetical protein
MELTQRTASGGLEFFSLIRSSCWYREAGDDL